MALTAPLNVHWELTNLCNLNCVHCYQQDDGPRTGLPHADLLHVISRRIVEAGVFEVTLTGGEVLLVPQLQDIVTYFNSHGLRPHITSNGMLVTDEKADWLAAADVTFQVSLDAADPGRHNDVRRSPHAYDRALEGVTRLVERGVEVSFAYTAMPDNLQEIEGVLAVAAERGVGRVCVGEVLPEFGDAANRRRLEIAAEPFGQFVAGLRELRERYRGRVDLAAALLSGHLHDQRLRASPCTALDRDLAILHDGWAYPCPFVRDRRRRLGDVRRHDLRTIWGGAQAQRFREEKRTQSTKHCVSTAPPQGPVLVQLGTRPPTTE
ncbi:radical SAM/SPASM domain-containing protein [Streptomyces bungoensis]|uniref:radical SAM/SPASM domain-containing protein n=1 Tax=Streptomyces bungoensis TaxID=285568 RepID=UPI0033EF4B99